MSDRSKPHESDGASVPARTLASTTGPPRPEHPAAEAGPASSWIEASGPATDFERRLAKSVRHRRRRAARRGEEAFRAYDHDLPDWPLVADLYGERVHVQLDAAARSPSRDEVRAAVARGLDLPLAHVHVKERRRKGGPGPGQYERLGEGGAMWTVREGAASLLVNLDDYFDAGLFVDHRPARRWVGEVAAGLRVLNLFAYTGAFSVHAALAGAARVTTVDTSRAYLDWARRNFGANGLDPDEPRFRFVRDDALAFLHHEGLRRSQYDLVVVDPPTRSVSRSSGRRFEINRDHPELLSRAARVLRAGGALLFSTNAARFRFAPDRDPWLGAGPWVWREVTRWTVPEDCARSRPHRAWLLWRSDAQPTYAPLGGRWLPDAIAADSTTPAAAALGPPGQPSAAGGTEPRI